MSDSSGRRKLPLLHFTGCLLGGAVGDALGAPIEFMSIDTIRAQWGPDGVTGYVEYEDGTGAFTDDTQMTLFTAEGLLRARHREVQRGIGGAVVPITWRSYQRWLLTQGEASPVKDPELESGWLIREKDLFARRAPGNTCLGALRSGQEGTMEKPINNSKGCGTIMRVAPAGLMHWNDPEAAFRVAAETSALTHGHPTGFLSAGHFAAMIAEIAAGSNLAAAVGTATRILVTCPDHKETLRAVEKALELHAKADACTPEAIATLGAAWIAEEALAISLFCALQHCDDFSAAVLAAVNHSGDCDSTGAIVGNIVGLLLGRDAIPRAWITNLRAAALVEAVGEDLHTEFKGGTMDTDEAWWDKYPGF